MTLPAAQAATFEANRARGAIELHVGATDGVTRRTRVHESGSLRVRFPNAAADALEAVVVNTAGGVAGGDEFSLDVRVGNEASLTVTTAAAEKVYRSLDPDAEMSVKLDVGMGGRLTWLPQETILFDRARFSRSIDVNLAANASLLLAEAVVFGRSAMGEAVVQGNLFDRWRGRLEGRLIFAETWRLDGHVTRKLAEPAIANGAVAFATLLLVPGVTEQVDAVRALQDRLEGEAGISAWNGICIARFCAPSGAALRHDLTTALAALNTPLPRLWLN